MERIMKYYVRLIYIGKELKIQIAYLTFRDKTKWCKRTALKHAKEFIAKNPDYTYKLEMEN